MTIKFTKDINIALDGITGVDFAKDDVKDLSPENEAECVAVGAAEYVTKAEVRETKAEAPKETKVKTTKKKGKK